MRPGILLFLLSFFFLTSCGTPRPSSTGVYWWKTTLDWSADDTARLSRAGVDRVGLRLFDWGVRGEEGPLTVRRAVPADVEVVPVAYVTTARLAAWAAEGHPEPGTAATDLLSAMDRALAPAWPGTPKTWQLDADWSASTRAPWSPPSGTWSTPGGEGWK
jgi:hypothetical protein